MAKINIAIKVKTTSDVDIALTLHPFSEENIKVGNLKDPAKIEEKIKSAKDSHLSSVEAIAKLSGVTARICAIGIFAFSEELNIESHQLILDDNGERKVIEDFFNLLNNFSNNGENEINIISWYGSYFDIPMLYQRALVNNLKLPIGMPKLQFLNTFNADKFRNKLIDLGKVWNANRFSSATAGGSDKLLQVAYAFNLINKFKEKVIADKEGVTYSFEEHYNFNNADFDALLKNIESEKDWNKAKQMLTAEVFYIKELYQIIYSN